MQSRDIKMSVYHIYLLSQFKYEIPKAKKYEIYNFQIITYSLFRADFAELFILVLTANRARSSLVARLTLAQPDQVAKINWLIPHLPLFDRERAYGDLACGIDTIYCDVRDLWIPQSFPHRYLSHTVASEVALEGVDASEVKLKKGFVVSRHQRKFSLAAGIRFLYLFI